VTVGDEVETKVNHTPGRCTPSIRKRRSALYEAAVTMPSRGLEAVA
jgi:hypothetical protein